MVIKPDYAGYFTEQFRHEVVEKLLLGLPEFKRISCELIEVIFTPKTIAKQIVLAVAIETGAITINQILLVIKKVYSNFSCRSCLIHQLEQQQFSSESQDDWMELAEKIDAIQGRDAWREDPECPLYESDRISSRIDELVHLMRRCDIFELMFTLRGGIARNRFGLLHEGLFSKALAGSKVLVETYHNVVCAALEFVCDAPVLYTDDPIPTDAKLAFFNETRHSYGRTALMLSGGAALGFYHIGVVKALMENGLLPRVLSGASAGSIVAAMIGTRTDEECQRDLFNYKGTTAQGHSGKLMANSFRVIKTSEEEVESSSALLNTLFGGKRLWQLLAPIGIRNFTSVIYDILLGHRADTVKSDTDHFRKCCRANIGQFTFQEAFDRTGRILNIIVSPQNRSDPPRLLNYLTTPHVLVWSAAVASSSLPGVFEANKLLIKDADGTERYETATAAACFIDGSIEADLPMQQLSEMFNINHFIISQANPHAALFASFNFGQSIWSNPLLGFWYGVLLFLKKQAKAWIGNTIELIGGQRAAPLWDTRREFGKQIFTQEYEGRDIDISFNPWANHRSHLSALFHCLYNPTEDDFHEWTKAAERETWRYIPKIKSHVAEEVTLDRCVQKLRKQLLIESAKLKRGAESTAEKMSKRLPSFFTSASLVNMSGLGVTDRFSLDSVEHLVKPTKLQKTDSNNVPFAEDRIEILSGWKGLGLRGNHSSGSLNRTHFDSSSLFLMDEESDDEVLPSRSTEQTPGDPSIFKSGSCDSQKSGQQNIGGYLKTTNMADFYYRKIKSSDDMSEMNNTDSLTV